MPCPTVGPGSGAYKLPTLVGFDKHDITKPRRPMYSFGGRSEGPRKPQGPGPQYSLEKVGRHGKESSPQFSLQSRHPELRAVQVPAPNAYAPMIADKGPQYSLQSRGLPPIKSVGPGAAAYGLPTTIGRGGYSMTSRHFDKVTNKSPGPAAYGFINPDTTKTRAGIFSITSRHPAYAKLSSPGPAAYYSQFNGGKGPYSFSFGVKHWDCAPPYIIEEDNIPC